MVQTEAYRPCGAHIFSEKVAFFGIWNLKVAKKGAQKYKKYDIKIRLCTVSRFPPIVLSFREKAIDNSKIKICRNVIAKYTNASKSISIYIYQVGLLFLNKAKINTKN